MRRSNYKSDPCSFLFCFALVLWHFWRCFLCFCTPVLAPHYFSELPFLHGSTSQCPKRALFWRLNEVAVGNLVTNTAATDVSRRKLCSDELWVVLFWVGRGNKRNVWYNCVVLVGRLQRGVCFVVVSECRPNAKGRFRVQTQRERSPTYFGATAASKKIFNFLRWKIAAMQRLSCQMKVYRRFLNLNQTPSCIARFHIFCMYTFHVMACFLHTRWYLQSAGESRLHTEILGTKAV